MLSDDFMGGSQGGRSRPRARPLRTSFRETPAIAVPPVNGVDVQEQPRAARKSIRLKNRHYAIRAWVQGLRAGLRSKRRASWASGRAGRPLYGSWKRPDHPGACCGRRMKGWMRHRSHLTSPIIVGPRDRRARAEPNKKKPYASWWRHCPPSCRRNSAH